VVLPSGGVVNRLAAGSFVAHSKDEPNIQSLNPDLGPRRILFVVETGKQVTPVAREVEAAVISYILTNARPQDSFALLTTHASAKEIKFGASRAALSAAVEELKKAPEGKNVENAALDAILDGASWLQPHQSGDAIFVLTMGIEGSHRARYSRVRDGLVDDGIRVFGFHFGDVAQASTDADLTSGGRRNPLTSGVAGISSSPQPNRESLLFLSRETGGAAVKENVTGVDHSYQLTDDRLKRFQYAGLQEYKAVIESYRMTIKLPARNFALDLTDAVREAIPSAIILYPTRLPKCGEGSKVGAVP
jgi:hypothetical protein